MEEIKYRAWDTRLKKMYSQEDLKNDNRVLNPYGVIVGVDKDSFAMAETEKDIKLWNCDWIKPLMYIGVEDKNGQEIFEGDIFPCLYERDGCKHKNVVIFDEEKAMFRLKYHRECQQLNVNQCISDMSGSLGRNIIGNIYENPELLK